MQLLGKRAGGAWVSMLGAAGYSQLCGCNHFRFINRLLHTLTNGLNFAPEKICVGNICKERSRPQDPQVQTCAGRSGLA